PVDRVLQQPIAGQVDPRAAGQVLPGGDLRRELTGRIAEQPGELALRVREALVRAGRADPEPLCPAGRDRHLVPQLAALASAERPVLALARHRVRERARADDLAVGVLRAAERVTGVVAVRR